MSQLQLINNTIPASFEGMTKTDLTTRAMLAVEHILENGGALQAAEILSSMEFFIKEMRGHKAFNDYVREEAGKWNGKYTSPSGTKIELAETGTKYHFDKCNDSLLFHLEHQAEAANNAVKERQEFLKKVPANGMETVFELTGEVERIYPPYKTSNSSFKLTLAK